jgi:hypothetical protein
MMERLRWLNCLSLAVPTLLASCCLLVLPSEAQSGADAEISVETTIQWIDKLTSQHASTECAMLRHSTRLCVSQLHIPEDYPGRSGLQVAWVTFPSAGILLDISTTKMDLPKVVERFNFKADARALGEVTWE